MNQFFTYDQHSDSLYIFAKEGQEEEARELVPGVNIELNNNGDIIGIEILRASKLLQSMVQPAIAKIKTSHIVQEPSVKYTARKKKRS